MAIRQFVHDLFKHYELHLPQWQDHVWYELYRQCDRNMDYALELSDVMDFAKHCFELSLHSYATVTGSAAHQPLGHGYKEMEVAATIQSVLASALNPSAGGALYNVTVDIFQQLDYNRYGRIEWNNGEVKGFVTNVFSSTGFRCRSGLIRSGTTCTTSATSRGGTPSTCRRAWRLHGIASRQQCTPWLPRHLTESESPWTLSSDAL